MSRPERPPRLPLPAIGARVPAGAVRAGLAALGLGLCLTVLPEGFLRLLGLGLVVAAVINPAWLTSWALLLLLAARRLAEPFTGLDAELLVLIAGLHALHVLGALSLVLPVRGWLQLRILRRPLLGYLTIQAVVQPFAVALLLVLSPDGVATATWPVAALVGALALLGTVLVLRLRP